MELKHELREMSGLLFCQTGWGNGYVHLPPEHPFHGVHYDEIPVDVHGGLTYSENENGSWVIGFDTRHHGDTLEKWPMEKVEAETIRLRDQLERLSETSKS